LFSRNSGAIISFSILSIICLSQIFSILNVNACTSDISLNPASINGPPPDIGETFNLILKVTGQAELWGWKISLKWDPRVLDLQKITENSFLKKNGIMTTFETGVIDHSAGTLRGVSSKRLSPCGLAGSGDLATFTFKVVGYSASASSIQIFDDELRTAQEGYPLITHTTTGSTITIIPTSHNPTAIISSPSNNQFVYIGESIILDGSNSKDGFNIHGVRPIKDWVWTLTGAYIGSFNGTIKQFMPIILGDISIQLTVTAPDETLATGYDPVDTTSVIIHVIPYESTPNYTVDSTPPVVFFTILGLEKDNTTYINKILTFNASKSYDPNNGVIKSYLWDFGDSTSGNGKIIKHTYSSNGFYIVKLTCADAEGNSAWKTANLMVKNPPKVSLDLYTRNTSNDGSGYNKASGPFEPSFKVNLFAILKIDETPAQNVSVSFIVKMSDSLPPFINYISEKTDQFGTAKFTFTLPSIKTPGETSLLGNWIAEARVEYYNEIVADKMPFKVEWAIDLSSNKTSMKILDNSIPISFIQSDKSAIMEFKLINQFQTNVNEDVIIHIFDHEKNEIYQKRINNYEFLPEINILVVPFTILPNAILGEASVKISIVPINYDPNAIIPNRTFDKLQILTMGTQLNYGILLEKNVFEGHILNMTILAENKGDRTNNAIIRIYCNQTQIGILKTQVNPKSTQNLTYSWNTSNYQPGLYTMSASIEKIEYSVLDGNSITLGNVVIKYPSATFILQWFGLITILTAVISTIVLVSYFGRDPKF
jgi:PKD repeat protein